MLQAWTCAVGLAASGADGNSALDDPKPVDAFVTSPLRSAAGRPDARSGTRGTLRPQLIGPVSVNTRGEVNHQGQGTKPRGSSRRRAPSGLRECFFHCSAPQI